MIIENDHHDEVPPEQQGSAAVPEAGAGDDPTATADPKAGTDVQMEETADQNEATAGTADPKAGTAVSKAGTAVPKAGIAVDPKTVVIVGNGAVNPATIVVMGNGARPLVLTPVAKPPNIAALKALRAPELPAAKPNKASPNGLAAASGKSSEPNTDTSTAVVNNSIATAATTTLTVNGSTSISTAKSAGMSVATTSVTAVGAAATTSSGNGSVAVAPALVNGAVTIPARMKMQLQLPPLSQQKSPTAVGFPPHKPQVNPKVSCYTSTEVRYGTVRAPSFQCFGSGPFHEQAKMSRKTLTFYSFCTCYLWRLLYRYLHCTY